MTVNKELQEFDYGSLSQAQLVERAKEQDRIIKKLAKKKKYGLVWEEKPEHVAEMCKDHLPVLSEVKTKEIHNNSDSPNILIEGDNYHALSVLNYTHRKKIDVIYIDPPYNTGKEFTYNDKLVDNEDAYKHSKWISFMNKRLSLAKKLLSRKGVIFISIDDNEQAQLRIICNEVFGQDNFIANIVWQKKYSPQNDAKYFSDMHDFILVYARRKNINGKKNGWIRNLLPRTEEMDARYKNPDNDPRGVWKSTDMSVKTYNPTYDFPITTPTGRIVNPPPSRCWRFSQKRYEELLKDNRIWFGQSNNNVPSIKKFLTEVKEGIVPVTWWDRYFAGHNQDAKQEIDSFNLQSSFDTPKPVKLIKRILEISSHKNSIILDFMAGSGTTGQATLELNNQDNGNRKFILCTNNENNICTNVCHPRLKKAIKGYKNLKGETVEGLGGNLKYFKADFVPSANTDKNKKKLMGKATEILCIKEDCFEQVKSVTHYKIFKNSSRHMAILYDDAAIDPFKKEIKKRHISTTVYTFSLDEYNKEEEFEDVAEFVRLKPVPFEIISAYGRIFR